MHLHGERLVELPEIDVLDLEARPLEELGHGEHRSDAHFVGLAAGDGEAPEYPQRLEAASAASAALITHAGARAVGELARVARRDHAARRRRLDLRNAS